MNAIKDCAVIDLFCGVGGLTHGFVREGFRVVAGTDMDSHCKYAYEKNNNAKFIAKPIEDVSAEEILKLFGDSKIKILVGCAPCQPFSTYTQKKEYDKWKLLYEFAELIETVHPDIVSMENVPRLVKFKRGQVFNDFRNKLEQLGFYITWLIVFCPDYGIPQRRSRLVLVASKFGLINFLEKTHSPDRYKTVADAIGHLQPLQDGEASRKDLLHRAASLSPVNKERIKSSVPGGTWRDWEHNLVSNCHTKLTGKGYFAIYGRMLRDEPSPTITTQFYNFGSGRFGHPDQDRALSPREAALLQTFPEDYVFVDPNSKVCLATLGRHIGNAVPVDLARVIAKSIAAHIEGLDVQRT